MVHKNLGSANTYSECIELLQEFDYIDETLAGKLVAMTGLRNIPVHEYVQVELEKLYTMLNHLHDFNQFAKYVKKI